MSILLRFFSRSLLLAVAVGGAAPASSVAQVAVPDPQTTWRTRPWVGDAAFLSINALLSGVTAGILQEVRGGSFQKGFTGGAIGGVAAYGGRRIAVADFRGAGFMGREVAAFGASIVRNASDGRALLSRFAFPLGPVELQVHRDLEGGISARVDATAAAWLVAASLDSRLDFDAAASFSAGAPVFRASGYRLGTGDHNPNGLHVAGLILLGPDVDALRGHDVFGHERVHVLQYDFAQQVWGDPLENWVIGKVPGGSVVLRFVRPGFMYPWLRVAAVNLLHIEWADRPSEIEAEFLEHR